jgi:hypothetical protein
MTETVEGQARSVVIYIIIEDHREVQQMLTQSQQRPILASSSGL